MLIDMKEVLKTKVTAEQVQRVGALLSGMSNERFDSGETAVFTRQLEYIKKQTYDIRYAALKARKFIPVDNTVPTGAESFTWRAYDQSGLAKIIANGAKDLPTVEILGAEKNQRIVSIGSCYMYSIQDLRAAAFAGIPLDMKKANGARRMVENLVEILAGKGDTAAGLPGFTNAANVPIITPITGSWLTATPAQVVADMNKLVNSIVTTSKETSIPNTLLIPTARYSYLASTPYNTNDSRSILKVFLQNSPYIQQVDQWQYLDTADAGGTGPRAIAYVQDVESSSMVIPQEFEQFPIQADMLNFVTPCHMRFAGVSVHYPLDLAFMDGI